MLRPDVKIVLTEHSMIWSTAEWRERTRERTSGNENQPGPAAGIDYLRRQSPSCSVVLRDHSCEHLIRCQAPFRTWSAILSDRNGTHFHLIGPRFHCVLSANLRNQAGRCWSRVHASLSLARRRCKGASLGLTSSTEKASGSKSSPIHSRSSSCRLWSGSLRASSRW